MTPHDIDRLRLIAQLLRFAADVATGESEAGRDAAAMDAAIAALSTPPADDVREALIDAMIDVEVSGGMVEFGQDDRAEAAYLADAILSAPGIEVRPRGTVTDAEVEAAAGAICRAAEGDSLSDVRIDMRDQYMREARAALEAAREVRS